MTESLARPKLRALVPTYGPLAGSLFLLLRVVGAPVDYVFRLATKARNSAGVIDVTHFACLSLSLALLRFAPATSWILVAWPAVRVADTVHTFFDSFARQAVPRSKLRSVVLLFLHYVEIIVLFALVALFLQQAALPEHAYMRNGTACELGRGEVLFFSFVTAATIGFGDLTPNHSASTAVTAAAYSLVYLKTLIVLGITLVEFNRAVGSSRSQVPPPSAT